MEEVRENLLSRMNYNLGLVYQDGGLLVDVWQEVLIKTNGMKSQENFFLVSEV